MKYYAVRKGRVPGIYYSWDECRAQVDKFSGAEFKSFHSEKEAELYLNNKNFNSTNQNLNSTNQIYQNNYLEDSIEDDDPPF